MPLPLVPLASVRDTMFGTSVGSHPLSYTSVDVSHIGATIQPCVDAPAHRYIAHKVSLSTLKIANHLESFVVVFGMHVQKDHQHDRSAT